MSLLLLSCVSLSVQNRRVKRIVGGQLSAAPPPDDPVVFTTAYSRNSRVEGYRYWSLYLIHFKVKQNYSQFSMIFIFTKTEVE